jgi:hypothetical protein
MQPPTLTLALTLPLTLTLTLTLPLTLTLALTLTLPLTRLLPLPWPAALQELAALLGSQSPFCRTMLSSRLHD